MNLAGAGLGVIGRTRDADGRGDQLVQLGDRRLYAGADVEGADRSDRRTDGGNQFEAESAMTPRRDRGARARPVQTAPRWYGSVASRM